MKLGAPGSFGAQLKSFRVAAGFTQEELATIAGLSVHAVSALERGERRQPQFETVRALSAALDLSGAAREALLGSARTTPSDAAVDGLGGISLRLSLTSLLGREADLDTLRQWLADPAARLITLVGPGGVGKTRLALEMARVVANGASTRAVFVPLFATRSPAFVASAIAEALGLSDVLAVELPKRARVACGEHPLLLVLDNFEQVLDAAPLVTDLLSSVASLRVLATSRAPLRVRGEREYAVGPLALGTGPDAMSPDELARSPAVRLFIERARDGQPDFQLTPANGPTIAAICRRLDALPLALELAAPWIKVLPPEDLLRRLTDDVLLATAGPRDLPERQRTINATVAWSYRLLTPNEQRVFRRLGALPGRFPIEAAAAVLAGREGSLDRTDEALGAAAGLIDKSLLLRAESSVATRPLYQMLETVRAYAALELAASGERDDAVEGLVRYCTEQAALAEAGLVGPAQAEWLDRVRDDIETYRGILWWLIERGRPSEASGIGWGLLFYWLIRGHAAEAIEGFEQILSLPSLTPAAEARARVGAALMWFTKGELDRARVGLERALVLARAADDQEMILHAANLLAHVEHAAGNVAAAREQLTQSVERFRARALPWGIGSALIALATLAIAAGDTGQGERHLAEATSVLRQAGPWFLMQVLIVRANLAVRRGDADEAIALVRENLTRIRELHDKFAFVYALVPLAAAAVQKGDDTWAARILGVRDGVLERTGVTVVDTPVHDLRKQTERDAREHLGPDRWAREYAAGRRTAIDSAQDLHRFVADIRY
jgi:predicted ATPase/DNA-binding XRE family transcriptional regulator